VQRDYSGSETERQKVRSETVQDRLLHARIFEAQGLDLQTPLHLRDSLLKQAAAIRSSNRAVDEYDVDGYSVIERRMGWFARPSCSAALSCIKQFTFLWSAKPPGLASDQSNFRFRCFLHPV